MGDSLAKTASKKKPGNPPEEKTFAP
jgi:hypothetical protein